MADRSDCSEPMNLPEGIRSRMVDVKDLNLHILECGDPKSPLILLLHGFPELAFSWRKIIAPLSQLGYYVVAPDQRGYGRTKSVLTPDRPIQYDDDISPYRMLNLVGDLVALIYALGHEKVAAVIGHDFGSLITDYLSIIRPDMVDSIVLSSAPFTGAPPPSKGDASTTVWPPTVDELLLNLDPPRKHYTTYLSGPTANQDMMDAPQGLHSFFRGYIHVKSADWHGNVPHPLHDASQLGELPAYYVMPLASTMAGVARQYAPSATEIAQNTWLPDEELAVYAAEFGRTGFQGGLNWYRCLMDSRFASELSVFYKKKVEVPAMFISGRQDWGIYQSPRAIEKMKAVCTKMSEGDVVLVEHAGHWVQQEQPEEFLTHVRRFLSVSSGEDKP
ncbi:alpha/beta-hydrolase [Panus rudis PR-1116 ss-1]|nr:alpha/beta-hydrolase [Panus rudis PR-1116 ss-1]